MTNPTVLDVPFADRTAARDAGARWDPRLRAWLARPGPLGALARWVPEPHSPAAWAALDLAGGWSPEPREPTTVLHPHQRDAVAALVAAHAAASPGFLLADDVGLGKTHSCVAAIDALAEGLSVLVLAPLSVVAHWRRVIDATGRGTNRWCVTNYDRAKALLEAPPSAKSAKRRRTANKRHATAGRSRVAWDVVVCDEAHLLRNPTSQRAAAVRQLIGTDPAGRRKEPAFCVWMSATAGQHPLELSYLAPLLAARTGSAARELADFEAWCAAQGIAVRRGAFGAWDWERNDADLETMRELLLGGAAPVGLRRRPTDLAGWPEQVRIAHPVALTADQRALYDTAWGEFCAARAAHHRASNGTDEHPLVALLRYRQKASWLRVEATVELVGDLVANGRAVALSCEFLDTAAALSDALARQGLDCVRIAGPDTAAGREAARLSFQRGEVSVVVFTVREGISLHAGEAAASATTTERALVLHDPRWSAIATAQIEGRTHRDGQRALAYHCFAEGTAEEAVVTTTLERLADMKAMVGDDLAGLELLDAATA